MSLAVDLARALDPTQLAPSIGMVLDPWQHDALRSEHRRQLWNCSRQSGKSTTAALLGCHRATYRPGALILIVSPTQRQSSEMFHKVRATYSDLGRPVKVETANATTLELENASRIVSLPGGDANLRGFSGVDTVLIDEAARVDDATFHAVSPMVAVSGGTIIALSTPWGRRGWFFDAWEHGGATWHRVRVPATDCPRITPEFLAEQRATLGDWITDQEYGCVFGDNEQSLLSSELVDSLFTTRFAPLRLGAAPATEDLL